MGTRDETLRVMEEESLYPNELDEIEDIKKNNKLLIIDDEELKRVSTKNLASYLADMGLINANNLTIGENNSFEVGVTVGGIHEGMIIKDDDNLFQTLRRMLRPPVSPSYIRPTITITGTTPLNREIGEIITIVFTVSKVQNDGGRLLDYTIKRGDSIVYFEGDNPFTESDIQLMEDTTYQASMEYEQGPIKNDNEGNPDPTGRIEEGVATSSITYLAQRKAFFGRLTNNTIPNDSDIIRALENNLLNPQNNSQLVCNVMAGDRGLCFAYPSTLREPTSIIPLSLGLNVRNSFTKITVSVEGANRISPVDYQVYYLINEFPFVNNDRYTLTI